MDPTVAATARAEGELDHVLAPPPGHGTLPPHGGEGWRTGAGTVPFLTYVERPDVNWSDDLEELHEESSRDHFIDVWTRRAVLEALAPAIAPGAVVADVGCSTGYLLEDLDRAHPRATLVGLDLIAAGLAKAHGTVPRAALALGDVTRLPLLDASVDALASVNVLEHVADDQRALEEFHRVLRPGGLAAIVVPAGRRLYDYYDRFLSHERRYGRGELAGRARTAGFEVSLDTHLGWTLHPAFAARKRYNQLRHPDPDEATVVGLVSADISGTEDSRVGRATTRLERRLLARGLRVPFGIRSFVVLRRPA